MQTRIPLEELNTDLQNAFRKVDLWAKESVAKAKKFSADDKENQEAHAERCTSLNAERDQLQQEATALKERLNSEQEEQDQAKAAADNAAEEAQRAQSCWREMQTNIQRKSERLTTQEQGVAEELAVAEIKLQTTNKSLQEYQDRLGLQLKESEDLPDELLMIFTCISESDPLREHVVGIRTDGSNQFQVTRCDPPVEGLEREYEQLQKSGDFAQFVRNIRSHFCALHI